MTLLSFANWLDATTLSTSLKDNFWAVPTFQSIHILSVCLVLTSAVVVSLRAWNLMGADRSPHLWARRLYPPQWWALLVLLITGVLQVLTEPIRELPNPAFQIKMAGVIVAVVLAQWMTRQFYSEQENAASRVSVRLTSILLVVLWLGIIFAGRWIAYV